MLESVKKIAKEKREYKEQLERAKALPEEYRFVFDKLAAYMWGFAGGDGSDMLKTQGELLSLFEEGAQAGRPVLDLTGEDVAGFGQELIRGNKLWTDRYRGKLNRDILEKCREHAPTVK